eukprot:m.42983 g.42983  ORF g.42983 m.42983 type:complete len:174 (-) comp12909_c0_seq25:1144-1665(-)
MPFAYRSPFIPLDVRNKEFGVHLSARCCMTSTISSQLAFKTMQTLTVAPAGCRCLLVAKRCNLGVVVQTTVCYISRGVVSATRVGQAAFAVATPDSQAVLSYQAVGRGMYALVLWHEMWHGLDQSANTVSALPLVGWSGSRAVCGSKALVFWHEVQSDATKATLACSKRLQAC